MKSKLSLRYHLVLGLFFGTMLTSLMPENIYVLFLFSVACLVFLPLNKYWDKACGALILFSIFYCINQSLTVGIDSGFNFLSILMAPASLYRFGRWTVDWLWDDTQRLKFLFGSLLCYLLPMLFLTIQDISLVGIVNPSRHFISDFSKDDAGLAATLYGLMSSVGVGFVSVLFIKQLKFKKKVLYSIPLLISVLTVVHLVNRTGIGLLIICVLFAIAYSSKRNPVKLIIAAVIVVIIVFTVMESGIISQDIFDAYTARENDSSTNTAEFGGRLRRWELAIVDVFTNPFGFSRDSYGYAHNLWLDLGAIGGWFALLPFLMFTIKTFSSSRKLFHGYLTPYRMVLISVFVSMFCNAMVEPVIEGSILFFGMFIMISGMVIALSKENDRLKRGQQMSTPS